MPRGFIPGVCAHKDFSEIIVESTVVVYDRGKQGEDFGKDIDELRSIIFMVGIDNL